MLYAKCGVMNKPLLIRWNYISVLYFIIKGGFFFPLSFFQISLGKNLRYVIIQTGTILFKIFCMNKKNAILIGCSGYYYPQWKGTFYPQKLPASKWLEYYSSVFNT